jgi:hypothetical protein
VFFGTANIIFFFGKIEGLSSSNPGLASLTGLGSQAVIVRGSPTRLALGCSFYVASLF